MAPQQRLQLQTHEATVRVGAATDSGMDLAPGLKPGRRPSVETFGFVGDHRILEDHFS